MSSEVIKVLDHLGQQFGVAVDWTQQNMTPYLQELTDKVVAYKFYMSVFWTLFSFLFVVISTMCLVKANNKKSLFKLGEYYEMFANGNFRAWCAAVDICISVILFIVFLASLVTIVKCVVIPEMVVYDFVRMLISRQ